VSSDSGRAPGTSGAQLTLRAVLRPKGSKGFVVLPHRWKVERSIGWIMNAQRNCRDYERLPQHAEAT
jgi:transposase